MSDDLAEPPLPEQRPAPTMFTLDDAFGDDAEEQQMQFSSSIVREELVRNFGQEQEQDTEEIGYLDATRDEAEPDVITDSAISFADFNPLKLSLSEAISSPRAPQRQEGINSPNATMERVSLDHSQPEPEIIHRSTTADPPLPTSSEVDVSPSDPDSASQAPPRTPSSGHAELEKEASATSLPTESQIQSHHVSQSLSPSPVGSGGHRPSKSAGPSAFEKVMSKTRPQFLPPKPKDEDRKHLADWEKMMKLSRAAEDKRKKQLQEQRLVRERAIEHAIEVWEKEILPDWKTAANDPRLRKFWWRGIPPKLRSVVWERTVGNGLALSKDTYRSCLARARRSLASGSFPSAALSLMEQDISTTLSSLHLFDPNTGPMYADLKEMLCAWVVARSDEGLGYILGASKIAAMFLLNMAPAQAFICMRNLLERHCLRSFYGGLSAKDDVEAYYRIFDTLLADGWPKIYFNFKQHQVSPAAYLSDWITTIFLDHLPLEACARIWDVLLLEGDSFLYRAALAVLAVLEARLFFPERNELLELLRGEDKAALEIARREGKDLNNAKYEIYDVDEEKVWARIEEMEDWWKESTWTRLIQRELPDI